MCQRMFFFGFLLGVGRRFGLLIHYKRLKRCKTREALFAPLIYLGAGFFAISGGVQLLCQRLQPPRADCAGHGHQYMGLRSDFGQIEISASAPQTFGDGIRIRNQFFHQL